MSGRVNATFAVTKVRLNEDGQVIQVDTRGDTVTGEEPLEIRVGGQTLTTTMRTPGHDVELAHGFLHSEGHISSASDLKEARYCAGASADGRNPYNLLDVELTNPHAITLADLRLTTTTSACGVCGTSSIEALMKQSRYEIPQVPVDPGVVAKLPETLKREQKQFRKTGGIHAAGAFTLDGEPIVVREDVGRHNAADKVIGHLLMEGMLPASDLILVMSSRASFELVNKAAMAGFGMLVAVSAASSLAVETARETGMALVGFARGDRFNLYSGELNRGTLPGQS
ncbi:MULTISPECIES: formate dehydrogenase accessory sulfurtransferase FdhD [unclassified Corynebacterium]|uniref:formate dehydrogenase accessory sulfurtransferase FdhD n=1 Tax=unclassified Corynebacterium TaxID=2624378 RepID=UPI0008A4E56A|nr:MULTISPECIES: formate dehydrogenase accessory sulfurtransferase FdhD [unclassified Corynebacterium]OFN76631.1 sufurtransferase FdhD [Corynebacterium sp. HMSC074E01]OFP63380.1 sufurtransferase FdhD [Corynebacterium sp. HMSC074C01]OHO65683.1 sufurtransferase FdhD [Corynebacterium sp. HMSC036D02]